MVDFYDTASQGIDQGKAALLQAIATQGSQAHAALQAGQDQIASAKQAAIQQALAGAQQRGAQQPELDQITQTISRPFDSQLSALSASQATRGAGFDQQSSAAGTYMDQAKAALPALRTQLAQKVALMQSQAQAQALSAKQASDLKNIELQIAQINLQKAQQDAAKAQQPPGVSKILADQFGGLNGFTDLVDAQAPALRSQQNADYRSQQSGLRALGAQGNLAARADSREADPGLTPTDVADAIGQQAGLAPGQGAAFYQSYLDKQDAAGQPKPGSAEDVRSSKQYADAAAELLKGVRSGAPTAGIAQGLNDHFGPDIARQILTDYSAVLPAKPPYGG